MFNESGTLGFIIQDILLISAGLIICGLSVGYLIRKWDEWGYPKKQKGKIAKKPKKKRKK